jgi:hypothetical protein
MNFSSNFPIWDTLSTYLLILFTLTRSFNKLNNNFINTINFSFAWSYPHMYYITQTLLYFHQFKFILYLGGTITSSYITIYLKLFSLTLPLHEKSNIFIIIFIFIFNNLLEFLIYNNVNISNKLHNIT